MARLPGILTKGIQLCVFIAVFAAGTGCREKQNRDGKVHVSYWEKWTGFEAEAMQKVVDEFNRSQDRIVVEYLNTSQIDRKTLLATAGGDPPDIAGLWLFNLYSFADSAALTPLDDLIIADGQTPQAWLSRYSDSFAHMLLYRDKVWGALSTPSAALLHWNKAMFRAAGLDPERPPRTVEELDAFAEKLTIREPDGSLKQMGFLPQEPGYYAWAFPQWFGGSLFDGSHITIGTDPKNLAAYKWVESYSRKYGADTIKRFSAAFGPMASSQSPFFTGKVAMELNGVWFNNFIRQFAPGLEYGVAPWPAATPGLTNFTAIDADVLVIPRGAKHPREAWEFIKYVSSINPKAQTREELRGMELLCLLHEKFSPMREWSPYFEKHHPHPFIAMFREAAESPQAVQVPKIGIWQEYSRELSAVFDSVRLLYKPPEGAVAFCQKRVSESWERHRESVKLHATSSFPSAQPQETSASDSNSAP